MAYSYQTGALRRKEHAEQTRFEYGKILSAEEKRKKDKAERAAQGAVKLKAGETVHDLMQKGLYRKTKSVMEQDYFKSTQFGPEDDAVNLFTSGRTSNIPGSQLLIPDTPRVNPSAYETLGRELAEINPGHNFGIPGQGPGEGSLVTQSGGKTFLPRWESDMDASTWHTKIGEKYSKQITKSSKGLKDLNIEGYTGTESVSSSVDLNLTDELVESAGSLVEGEAKLLAEMGTWGKLGKALGPIGSVLNIVGGARTLADPYATEGDKVAGGASLTAGVMTGTGYAIGAGYIGGGAAAGVLGTTAAANFWNPVGWGIGIGAGLYGIGKGVGIF